MGLTESRIKSAKPRAKRYRLTDGGGLVLDITPKGKKTWRFRYRRDGKDAVASLGDYPTMTLLEARQAVLDVKRAGVAPALVLARDAEMTRTAPDSTSEALARAYMKREKPHWAVGHHERFQNRMEKDVFPVIGDMDPRDICRRAHNATERSELRFAAV